MMRMVFWRELKWLIASELFGVIVTLTFNEASSAMRKSLYTLALDFENDPKWSTVRMRK